jgi:phage shock protein A
MNESITKRVSRLISGSINAIVDKAESMSPELVMKETIREVDSTIDEVKLLLGRENIELRKTKSQLENEKTKYKNLSQQIDVAINENRDDLAKLAISRQMDIEAQIPILEESLLQIEKNIIKLENYIDALNAKKREMQKDLEEYLTIKKEQDTASNIESNVEKADAAFSRVSADINSRFLNEDAVKLAELDKLVRDNRVSERLESLKASKK